MRGELKKRGQNWFARIYEGRDASGRRRYVSKTFEVKKDAEQWITATARNKDMGIAVASSTMNVKDYLTQWLDTAAKGKVKEKTFDGYQDILDHHIKPKLGARPLAKLTTLDIQQTYNAMSAAGLSPRTVQYTNMIVSQALKQAVTWRMLLFNPCDGVQIPRQVQREMQVFWADQVRRFLAVAKFDERQWGALFSVAVTAGPRPSEYLALKWPDLDLDRRIVSIKRSIDFKADGTWGFSDNKTGRSRRTIKLHVDVTDTLKAHRAAQDEQRRKAGGNWAGHDLVFCTRLGTPLERNNVKRAFHRLIDKANENVEDDAAKLPKIRLYDLRHTAATLGLSAGVPAKVVSEMLGHASIALTLNTYSHVLPHMQDDAADKVEALLRGTTEASPASTQFAERRTSGAQDPLPTEGRVS